VFPNPAGGSFIVRLPGSLPCDARIAVFDAVGKRVAGGLLPAGTAAGEVDVSGLPAGVYVCRVLTGGGMEGVKRIVVVGEKIP